MTRDELLPRFTAVMTDRLDFGGHSEEESQEDGWDATPPGALLARALSNLGQVAHQYLEWEGERDSVHSRYAREVANELLDALADCANYCAILADRLLILTGEEPTLRPS